MSSPKIAPETALKNGMNSPLTTSSPPPSSPCVPNANNLKTFPLTQNTQSQPLSELIGETFPPFDHQLNIVTPFNDEANRDLIYERELCSMLLDVILETHAWSSARPKHESTKAAHNIEQKIVSVMETEKEQEKTRERLNEFITRMKTALAALTGLGI